MDGLIQLKKFSEINLGDPFFDSLKGDYQGFTDWFKRKANEQEQAYILESDTGIEAFLYLKVEHGPVTDVIPSLNDAVIVKIGTMKINPHGTRLGERFIKKAFDFAVSHGIKKLYVTVFPKHTSLINIYRKYGFEQYGTKKTGDGEELVLVKSFISLKGDVLLDYPVINSTNTNKYLLSIYPEFHTRLFPDSILKNESFDVIEDVSHTNSIHKAYICSMDVAELKAGDILVIYRTSDKQGPARFRSVATSICVVEELRARSAFSGANEFIDYCKTYSVFTENELARWYRARKELYVIRMTYNVAMTRRLTRGKLIDEVGLDEQAYWGFLRITNNEFKHIIELGGVNESLIID